MLPTPFSNRSRMAQRHRIIRDNATVASAAVAVGMASVLVFATAGAAGDVAPMRDDLSASDRTRVHAVTRPTSDFAAAERFEANAGGAGTTRARPDRDAFSQFGDNLDFEDEEQFKLGNALFRKLWVSSPASTLASDGLGPVYNARSCQGCHIKDGRGHPPADAEDDRISMFLRLSVPPRTDAEREALADGVVLTIPEPTYGGQLQDFGVPGVPAEGRMTVVYRDRPVELADGTVVTLRDPVYGIDSLGYGPVADDVLMSPRVAPPMIGLGLIEHIHAADILAQADPDDADGDGISGRASLLRSADGERSLLGRFGWKASAPTIRAQSAAAFAGDIGISTPDAPGHWGDCTSAQRLCREAPVGVQSHLGDTEAPDPVLDLVTFYSQNLAVPVRRDIDDPEVLRGKKAFYESGCVSCHTPKYVTRRDAPHPAHRFQLVWPYSDFLLHDMGDGLADGRPVGQASGSEWKTPPLWGIGLTEAVNGHTFFLHDGRARSLLEAVLWHGGEAEAARDEVIAMDAETRRALIAFLESL